MLITPLPGVDRGNLLSQLGQVHIAASNLLGGSGPGNAQDRVSTYLEWVTSSLRQLGNQVSAADLGRLVLTPGYDRLLSTAGRMTGTDIGTQRVLNGMLSLELTQRTEAFDAAVKTLRTQIEHWSIPGRFVVADTSFYIQHPDKLEEADFRPLLGISQDPVHVLVPVAVVDELDGLKKSKDKQERWRSRYTLAVLDRVLATTAGPAEMIPEDFSMLGTGGLPRGRVTIEMVFDPPGHVRLPITDDEIIDRTLALQPLAGRDITLLTYDTGQSHRARNAGLDARKLSLPAEEEPAARATPGSRTVNGR